MNNNSYYQCCPKPYPKPCPDGCKTNPSSPPCPTCPRCRKGQPEEKYLDNI